MTIDSFVCALLLLLFNIFLCCFVLLFQALGATARNPKHFLHWSCLIWLCLSWPLMFFRYGSVATQTLFFFLFPHVCLISVSCLFLSVFFGYSFCWQLYCFRWCTIDPILFLFSIQPCHATASAESTTSHKYIKIAFGRFGQAILECPDTILCIFMARWCRAAYLLFFLLSLFRRFLIFLLILLCFSRQAFAVQVWITAATRGGRASPRFYRRAQGDAQGRLNSSLSNPRSPRRFCTFSPRLCFCCGGDDAGDDYVGIHNLSTILSLAMNVFIRACMCLVGQEI